MFQLQVSCLARFLTGAALIAFMAAGCEPPPLTESGVVGVFGRNGLGPGEFTYPRALTIDARGRVYVVDKSARVQRFSPDGEFQLAWSLPEMQAGKPVGLYAHYDGRVFVADTHYHRVIVYDADGKELARFGEPGDGDGQFQLPTDVAVDARGFIYVSEYNGNDRVTQWSPSYKFVQTVVSGEYQGLPLRRPAAIDIDAERTLWVADACNHRILRFDLTGKLLSAWGTMGRESGEMRYPYDIASTRDGRLAVCEFGNNRIQWFDAEGRPQHAWGVLGRRLGELWAPWGVAIGPGGRLYIVDSLNDRVQIVKP
jgi:DNA-binding beta-propeller fold protein YncE